MNEFNIRDIRATLRGHKAALRSIGLLYRRPYAFSKELEGLPFAQAIRFALALWLHAMPYIISLAFFGRLFLFSVLALSTNGPFASRWELLSFHIRGLGTGSAGSIAVAIVVGLAIGTAAALNDGTIRGTASGITAGLGAGLLFGVGSTVSSGGNGLIIGGVGAGIVGGATTGVAVAVVGGLNLLKGTKASLMAVTFTISAAIIYGIGYSLIGRPREGAVIGIAAGITAAVFGAMGGTVFGGIGAGLAVGATGAYFHGGLHGLASGITGIVCLLRLYYHPVHTVFLWPKARGSWYPHHPAAWDDMCLMPFPGLHSLLVAYAELEPRLGEAEIERIIRDYASQRQEALRAKVIVLARQSGRVEDLRQLDAIVERLPEGDRDYLSRTKDLRLKVRDICRLQAELEANERPVNRIYPCRLLSTMIENFRSQIDGFPEPLRSEFHDSAARWQDIAMRQLEAIEAILSKEAAPQVFQSGRPVDRAKEAFLHRRSIVEEIDKQLMAESGCPGIVLYGRRRMGKSTILRNLSGFLSQRVIPVEVSMEKPAMFTTTETFVEHVIESVNRVIPHVATAHSEARGLIKFSNFLESLNDRLGAEGRRLLLAVDEYKVLDSRIAEGRLSADLLAAIRNCIEHSHNIGWLFAGSYEITDLTAAGWTSYLISAKTIVVPLFTPSETYLLLTDPLKNSRHWGDAAARVRLSPLLWWGEQGIAAIHRETGGWPALVQSVALTCVGILNDEGLRSVNPDIMERALEKVVADENNFFYELLRIESRLPREWEYLSAFRRVETQPPPENADVASSLRRRLLVVEENGDWRLRVPLTARWLHERYKGLGSGH